jgi:PTS system nitrogen regulatory IIA component
LDDTQIKPGSRWEAEIAQAIARSSVAVLLVSMDFLNSPYIRERELEPVLQAQANGDLTILWVHVSACLFDQSPIAGIQGAHDVNRPLDSLSPAEANAVLAEICRRIHEAAMPDKAGVASREASRPTLESVPAGDDLMQYVLVLSGTIRAEDKTLVEALVDQLRAIARDSRMTLRRLEHGSVILTLLGTRDGYERLQKAASSGELRRVLEREIVSLAACDAQAPARPSQALAHLLRANNKLAAILPEGNVLVDVDATSKKRAFEHAGVLFESRHSIARATVTDNLFARERLGSTGLGQGVAIPHARVSGLQRPLAAVLRLREPIPFDAPDEEPVGLLIFLLVPEQSTQLHLAILEDIAEMLSDRKLREALMTVAGASDVHRLIQQWKPLLSAA